MKQARTFYEVIKVLEKQNFYLVYVYKNKRRTVLNFRHSNCAGCKIKPNLEQLKNYIVETYNMKVNDNIKGMLVYKRMNNEKILQLINNLQCVC